MPEPSTWQELHRTADQRELTAIVTTIAAMEFDVRCCDVHGNSINVHDAEGLVGPFCVQVRPEDHPALLEVLAEIIHEQDEFDAMLDAKRRRMMGTWRGAFLLLMIIVIAMLATLRLIDL